MKIKQIEFYLQAALDKVKAKDARRVSDALRPVLPDVIKTLHSILLDPDSDMSTRRWAIDTLSGFWRSLLSTSQSENRTGVKKLQSQIRRQRVKVAEKQTALRIHELRATADKKLATIGGNSGQART